jgi:ferritin-like metal-binding protein YciE
MNDREKNLQAYVNDMYAVEKHTMEAVERQLENKDVQKKQPAHQLIQRIHSTLKQHLSALESRLDQLGGRSVVKSAVASVSGAVAGAYDHVRTETVSSMLRDDYTALSMSAIAYTMLHTTALSLHDQATATLALKHLKNITPLITEISKVIPTLVVQDVHDDVDTADLSVAPQAVRNTQEAWDASHINQHAATNSYAVAG